MTDDTHTWAGLSQVGILERTISGLHLWRLTSSRSCTIGPGFNAYANTMYTVDNLHWGTGPIPQISLKYKMRYIPRKKKKKPGKKKKKKKGLRGNRWQTKRILDHIHRSFISTRLFLPAGFPKAAAIGQNASKISFGKRSVLIGGGPGGKQNFVADAWGLVPSNQIQQESVKTGPCGECCTWRWEKDGERWRCLVRVSVAANSSEVPGHSKLGQPLPLLRSTSS